MPPTIPPTGTEDDDDVAAVGDEEGAAEVVDGAGPTGATIETFATLDHADLNNYSRQRSNICAHVKARGAKMPPMEGLRRSVASMVLTVWFIC